MKKLFLNIRHFLAIIYYFFKGIPARFRHRRDASRLDRYGNKRTTQTPRIYYLGITAHSNLGDLAQHYCIKKWIGDNYPDYEVMMFESDTVVDKFSGFLKKFKNIYDINDIIVFQSGYTTQDLGGNHERMHRMIIDNIPYAKILMMPQTIYFEHEKNRLRCAQNHNKAMNMLFLARDFVSFEMAKEMFPSIRVKAYPDIVTTLIGTLQFNNKRCGVCLCTRNDGEKLYSKEEIDAFASRIEAENISVKQKDTQSIQTVRELRQNLKHYIEAEIESYSHFDVSVTDRYHGTIFSLCAGTPVIIIKTTDHKVTTGADWFKGVYDDYVYVAEDLGDAFQLVKKVLSKKLDHNLSPYFKAEYYDKLKALFESK